MTVVTVFSNIYQAKILSYYNYKTYKHKTHYVNVLHCLWKTRGVSCSRPLFNLYIYT